MPERNDESRHHAIKSTKSTPEVDYEFADLEINADTLFDSEYSDIIREVIQRILDAEAPLERIFLSLARFEESGQDCDRLIPKEFVLS